MIQRQLLVILSVVAMWGICAHPAGAVEVAPRITDREIIEGLAAIRGDIKRLEEGQHTLQKQIDDTRDGLQKQIHDTRDGLQKQIDDTRKELKEFMLWGFGVTFAGIFALIGFVLWDRRTALAPAVARTRQLEEREERLERVLKEMAQKDPNVAEALRHVGLL